MDTKKFLCKSLALGMLVLSACGARDQQISTSENGSDLEREEISSSAATSISSLEDEAPLSLNTSSESLTSRHESSIASSDIEISSAVSSTEVASSALNCEPLTSMPESGSSSFVSKAETQPSNSDVEPAESSTHEALEKADVNSVEGPWPGKNVLSFDRAKASNKVTELLPIEDEFVALDLVKDYLGLDDFEFEKIPNGSGGYYYQKGYYGLTGSGYFINKATKERIFMIDYIKYDPEARKNGYEGALNNDTENNILRYIIFRDTGDVQRITYQSYVNDWDYDIG